MNLQIPVVNIKDFYIKYLSFLNPVLKLRPETELPLLGSLLTLKHKYSSYKEETFYELLFSETTEKMIQEDLKVSSKSYHKSLTRLKEKGIIIDNRIIDSLLFPSKKSDFKINIEFKQEKK